MRSIGSGARGLFLACLIAAAWAAAWAGDALAQAGDPFATPEYLRDPYETSKPPKRQAKTKLSAPDAARPPVGQAPLQDQQPRPWTPRGRLRGSDCMPGQEAADPKCCEAYHATCRSRCQHDYLQSGDVTILNKCQRQCETFLRKCEEPPKRRGEE